MATDYEVNALIKLTDEASGKLGPINQGFGTMATKIGLATGALAAFALKAGNEFDTAKATIAEGTGAMGTKLDGLLTSFQNIGSIAGAGGLQATATAVADLNTHMGLTGPELENIAAKALQAGINTNNFGSFVRAAGLDARGASILLDQLKVASQNTGVSMDQLVGAANRMSGRMTAAGVPMNDQLALVVQLASEGGGYSALRSKLSEVATQIDQGNIPAISNLTTQLGDTEGAVVSTYGETVTFTEKLAALKDEAMLAFGPIGNVVGSLASMLTPILLLIPQLPLLAAGFRAAWLAIAGPAAIAAAGIIAVGAAAWTFRDNLANALAWVIDNILVPWASTFLTTAESAFSWVPGLGGKLRTARLAVKDFGDRSSGYLRDFASDMGKAETATDDLDTAVAGLSGPAGALGDLADDADAAAGALTGDNGMVAGLAAAEEAARLAKIEIDKIKLDEQELGRNSKQAMTNFSNAVKNWVTDNNVPDDVLMPPPPPLSAMQAHERKMGEIGTDGMKEFHRMVRNQGGIDKSELAPPALKTDMETEGSDIGGIFASAFVGGGGVQGGLMAVITDRMPDIGGSIETGMNRMGGMMSRMGGLLGGLASAGITSAIQFGLGALSGWISGWWKSEEKRVNDIRDQMQDAMSDLDSGARTAAQAIDKAVNWEGNEEGFEFLQGTVDLWEAAGMKAEDAVSWTDRFWNASNEEELEALVNYRNNVAAIANAFNNAKMQIDAAEDAAEFFGIDLADLGPNYKKGKLSLNIQETDTHFKALVGTGLTVKQALDAMSPKAINDLKAMATQSATLGVEIPKHLKPAFKQLVDDGKLAKDKFDAIKFDEKGNINKAVADLVGSIKDLIAEFKNIPKKTEIDVVTNYSHTGAPPKLDDLNIPHIAGRGQHGGPVASGKTYLVGEAGPELFVPKQSGTVVSNEDLDVMMKQMQVLAGELDAARRGGAADDVIKAIEAKRQKFDAMFHERERDFVEAMERQRKDAAILDAEKEAKRAKLEDRSIALKSTSTEIARTAEGDRRGTWGGPGGRDTFYNLTINIDGAATADAYKIASEIEKVLQRRGIKGK